MIYGKGLYLRELVKEDIDRAYEYLIKYNKPIKNIIPFIVATIKNGWCVDQIPVSKNI